ncbi:MAG: Wzz/FepE/Etk N-terminal domain-containing protein [Sphingomonas sp.]
MYSFLDWFEAVRYRWRMVAAAALFTLLTALVYLAAAPKTYTATANLLVDQQQLEPVDPAKGGSSQSVIGTQADLVRSPTVAARAAVLAGLDRDPQYVSEWKLQTKGRVPYDEWLKRRLLAALTVSPGKDTNVLEVSTAGRTPIEAARLANGFAQAAVAAHYRLRTEPAKAYATWLETRLSQARDRMVDAQFQLADFMKKTGLAQGDDLSSEGQQAASMAGELATAEARAAAAQQSKYNEAQGLGEAERISTVQSLRQDVASKTADLAKLEETFGPDYPDVKRSKAELATLQTNLQSELANAYSTFTQARNAQAAAERAAAAAAEQRLRTMSNRQRARLEAMGVSAAQYNTLKNDYSAAQRNYNDLDQKLAEMRLQSAVPQTEMQVLDTASPFLVQSAPDENKIIIFAVLIGLLLGAAGAILLEYFNPRVRSWGGIERLLGVRVIGKVALPAPPPLALPRSGPLLLQKGAA